MGLPLASLKKRSLWLLVFSSPAEMVREVFPLLEKRVFRQEFGILFLGNADISEEGGL